MKKLLLILLLSLIFFACNSEESDSESPVVDSEKDADIVEKIEQDTQLVDADSEPVVEETPDEDISTTLPDETESDYFPDEEVEDIVFNPDDPGYTVEFYINSVLALSQATNATNGFIMKTVREETDKKEKKMPPFGTCIFEENKGDQPECESDADCAPEQKCVVDEINGMEMPDSEKCKTPDRAGLNEGPVTISGFTVGDVVMKWAATDGVHKINGQGDGQIAKTMLNFDHEYSLKGDGGENIGAFTGSVTFPPDFRLTSHELVDTQTGKAVELDITKDIVIQWSDSAPGNPIQIAMTANNGQVWCYVEDTGTLTIKLEDINKLEIGDGFFGGMSNMITFLRNRKGKITGENITIGKFVADQEFVYNYQVKK